MDSRNLAGMIKAKPVCSRENLPRELEGINNQMPEIPHKSEIPFRITTFWSP